MEEQSKPRCKLIGTDGNVFALSARVVNALKKAGQKEKAKEFSEKLFRCENYDAALALMAEYVEIE